MLVIFERRGCLDISQYEGLEDLGGWGEDRDGPVGGTLVRGFLRFQERHYPADLPQAWDDGMSEDFVEKICQVGQAGRSQMLEHNG